MQIKIHTKPTGIPQARIAVAPGRTDPGATQVAVFMFDVHDMPAVAASLRLSTAEARALAKQLTDAADAAEKLP